MALVFLMPIIMIILLFHNKEELNDMTTLLKNINIISTNMNNDNEQIVLDNNKIIKNKITEIIVERRLKNFGEQLSTLGCNMHLITLPEFQPFKLKDANLAHNMLEYICVGGIVYLEH